MNKEKIKPETIIRTICLVIVLLNHLLIVFGKERLPFTDDEIYKAVSDIVLAVVAIWNWWKNNSFTQPAIKADIYLEQLRQEVKNGEA